MSLLTPCHALLLLCSYGVVLWELLMGQAPWEDMNPMQVSSKGIRCCLQGTSTTLPKACGLRERSVSRQQVLL